MQRRAMRQIAIPQSALLESATRCRAGRERTGRERSSDRPRSSGWGLASCVAGLLLATAGCGAASPVRAAADWDRSVDLRPMKTFSVTRSRLLPANLTPQQEALVGMVETLTKNDLIDKGYVE